ncbi:MAG: efflux transporter outer membrane subunit [Betaproteobacteria bacterium]|nr:efflux transporter outer membrane subunit [Betaproteobacteria bacterium]
MTARAVLRMCLALLLGGCAAVGPDYERPPMNLPGAYSDAPADIAAVAAVPVEWWKLYHDQRLDELVAGALARNADMRIAVARIEETDANLREAGAAFLPQVDLAATPARSRISNQTASPIPASVPLVRNNVRLALSTAFELDFWGKLRRALETTRALALGSRYAKEVVTLSLAGLTTQAYFSLRSLDAQVALTRGTLASREETLEMVRRRARGGIASDLDLNQAEFARADASVQLNELQRQRALAEHQLGALTGQLELTLAPGERLDLPLPPLPPAGLPSTLLQRRPDILQAEQQLIAANAQIGIAKAAMFPTISLTSYLGSESSGLSTLRGSGAGIWSLGFGLTLPIFDAGRYAARAQAAEARQKQAVGGYQKVVETAFREVADALATLRQTAAVEAEQQARAQAARNVLRLARLRYEAGYSAYLEVLEAQRAANEAELAFVRNRQSRLAASVDLMKALGGGWSVDQLPVSNAALRDAGGK